MKKYDVILYGATGFTGKRAVAYFKQNAPKEVTWAIAGRNEAKLNQVKVNLGLDVDVLVADAMDTSAIEKIVPQTKVILTTAGPYAMYGTNIVASCAKHGVHYVDITGEAPWVRDMLDEYGTLAKQTGAKIIPFCGFDSIPGDLGVWVLQQYMRKEFGNEVKTANAYYTLAGGGLNGGTLLSALNMMEKGEARRLANPKLLLKDLKNRDFIPKTKRQWRNHFAKDINKWVYPFVMAEINTKVVYRSVGLAQEYDLPAPKEFLYQEFHAIGKRYSATVAAYSLVAFAILGQSGMMRSLMRKLGPSSNQGPSEEQIEKGFFKLKMMGEDTSGNRACTTLSFQGDAGNKATVTFLSECALGLVLNEKELPAYNGFLTPVLAFGDVLEQRLARAGFVIESKTL